MLCSGELKSEKVSTHVRAGCYESIIFANVLRLLSQIMDEKLVVNQFTDIPINRGPFKEKTETGSNFTTPVFLQYVISSIMHQKVWFFQKKSDRNQSYLNLLKDFQKRKLIIFFLFPPLAVLYVGHTIYPRTPIDTQRRHFTPQDALY